VQSEQLAQVSGSQPVRPALDFRGAKVRMFSRLMAFLSTSLHGLFQAGDGALFRL
jgi:hypothetical protein